MRTLFQRALICILLSWVLAVLAPMFPTGSVANAQAYEDPAASLIDAQHSSQLTVPAGGPTPIRRKVTVGLDKSMLIDLPVDLQNVLVSNPAIVDAVVQNARQVYLLAKGVGEANAFFIGPDGEKVLFLEISVTRDLAVLGDLLRRLIPGSKIHPEMMGDSVVLSGSVMSPVDANRATELAAKFIKQQRKEVVNLLKTDAKEQVLLKVKVAEVRREALQRFGVDLPSAVLNNGNFTFAKAIANNFPVTAPIAAAASAIAPELAPRTSGGVAFQPSWQTNNNQVTALVQALERTGSLRTLAEPNLTAISGEKAKFLAGGEFPIPVAQDDGQVSIVFKEFGVGVEFRPVVLSGGRISLEVSAEVSEITSEGAVNIGNISIPGLSVRRAKTTVELPSGGTLAMAGLLSDDTRQNVEGFPGLKSVPVLGTLFRSNDYRRRETELVILVTPYLATHASRHDVAAPSDNYAPSHRLKELFLGHLNRVYGGPVPTGGRYHGDYGFIIDYPGTKG
ncbi:MAG: type II and III secretion system protein family protein [Hyphomicrobiaceae bacterium]